MAKSKLDLYAELQPLIRKEATDIANKIVKDTLQNYKFGNFQTPQHFHNNVDSPILPPTSIQYFQPLRTVVANMAAQGNILVNTAGAYSAFQYPNPVFFSEGGNGWQGGSAATGTIALFQIPQVGDDDYFLFANFSDTGDWHGIQLDI